MAIFRGKWSEFLRKKVTVKDSDIVEINIVEEKEKPTPTASSTMDMFKSLLKELPTLKGRRCGMSSKKAIDGTSDTTVNRATDLDHTTIPLPYNLKRRLLQTLKNNIAKRIHGNKRFGDIDHKRLYRIATTDKVFCRPEILTDKKYNVLLLVDVSGSMSINRKSLSAGKATGALVSLLQDIVSLQVMTFNGYTLITKRFDEHIPEKDILKRINSDIHEKVFSAGSSSNHDGVSIKKAVKELLKRTGQKILIVLSDGIPECEGCYTDCKEHKGIDLQKQLKEEIQNAKHFGIVTIGIGIKIDYVRYYYPEYVVLEDVNKIYETILEVFNKHVKNLPVRV